MVIMGINMVTTIHHTIPITIMELKCISTGTRMEEWRSREEDREGMEGSEEGARRCSIDSLFLLYFIKIQNQNLFV